jgi:hypothetical protein
VLTARLAILRDFNPGRHLSLVQFDVFGLFNKVIASSSKFALADVTTSSQGMSTVNPDTFLFWDDLHPTTRGHNISPTPLPILLRLARAAQRQSVNLLRLSRATDSKKLAHCTRPGQKAAWFRFSARNFAPVPLFFQQCASCARGLDQLEAAGLISALRKRGSSPVVTIAGGNPAAPNIILPL